MEPARREAIERAFVLAHDRLEPSEYAAVSRALMAQLELAVSTAEPAELAGALA